MLSNERLEITDEGKVQLHLKTAWRDGTSHLLLSPHEMLEKLAAIIPPPKSHIVGLIEFQLADFVVVF